MTNSLRTALVGAAAAVVFSSTVWTAPDQGNAPQAPAAGAAQGEGAPAAAGRGRGRNAGPALPTPRLPDGTVNLGRVPG